MGHAEGIIRVVLKALEYSTLGFAFVATLAAALLLYRQKIKAGRAITLIVSAAFLMVVSVLCRLPDIRAMQGEIKALRDEVATIRGTGPNVDDVPTQGELSKISYAGLKMAGSCDGGNNSKVNQEQVAQRGHLVSTVQRLDQVDSIAKRVEAMLMVFQNPFR